MVALECGDGDARESAAAHLNQHTYLSFAHGPFAWAVNQRVAQLQEAPLPAQVRWILENFPTRVQRARGAARGLAQQLGIAVPQHNTVRDYSVAAVMALVVGLPERFPEWDELFELAMLELKTGAHVGTTISECLSVIPWDVIADERKGDTITIRRMFRGYEVKWSAKLDRFGSKKGRFSDSKGRLAYKRRARAVKAGSRWTELLNDDERARYLGLAVDLSDRFAVEELAAAGTPVAYAHVMRARGNTNVIAALALHLSNADATKALDQVSGSAVVALLSVATPSREQLLRIAREGVTAAFDARHGDLENDVRDACIDAARSAHHEGTVAALRDGPPRPPDVPRLEMPLVERVAPKPKPRKIKIPATQLPVADHEPSAIVIGPDWFRVGSVLGDLRYRWDGTSWSAETLAEASSRLVAGDDFILAHQREWRIEVEGDMRPLSGSGAQHPIWTQPHHMVWTCAGGSLIVATSFNHGAVAFPVNNGKLGKPAELVSNKALGAATDGQTILVRRPERFEVYERAGKTWKRLQVEKGYPASVAISGDRFAAGMTSIRTKNGGGAVLVYRRDKGRWTQERQVTPPRPKTLYFGSEVGLAGNTLVTTSGVDGKYRWLFPDVSRDESKALRVARKSRWGVHPNWLVDAFRKKTTVSPLELTVYSLKA